jgi:hypothetical protein
LRERNRLTPLTGEALWTVLASWSLEKKKQFLVFVTGSSRLPLPGSELLKVEAPFVALGAAEHRAHLGMVPQAHTCDNLLEIPNYWEALLQVCRPLMLSIVLSWMF